jgi:predicted RNase H-like HicB family nuclease
MEYIAYLHKNKNSDYGVSFPDFPGCITAGSTLEEARRMAAEAISLHIAGMLDDGEAIPEPSTLDDLRGDPAIEDAVAFLVQAEEPERTVRINITAREGEIAEIDSRARAARLSRSAYMVRRALQPNETAVADLTRKIRRRPVSEGRLRTGRRLRRRRAE